MNELERKKLELELKKVDCAKEEMELKVLERLAEIDRLKDNIITQEKRINEIEEIL
jgi:hypothetical protein